jgi:hypothetical protein
MWAVVPAPHVLENQGRVNGIGARKRRCRQLAHYPVGVEKLLRGKISAKLGDEKCIPGSTKSLTGHPDALKNPHVF